MKVFYCVTVRIWFFLFIHLNSLFLFLLSSRPRRSLVFIIGLFFFFVLLYRRIYIYNGYLLMDELYRAVEQFLPTASGGMGGGSVPGGPPGDFPSIPVISPNNEFGENGEAPDSSKSASSSWSGPWIQEWLDHEKMGSEVSSHPAGDVSHPSSSSPAPAPKESWVGWEPQKFQPPEPPRVPQPETRTCLLKGAGGRSDPLTYNAQEMHFEGSSKRMAEEILQTFKKAGDPYGERTSTRELVFIKKKILNPNASLVE